jgi:hypothetical protein
MKFCDDDIAEVMAEDISRDVSRTRERPIGTQIRTAIVGAKARHSGTSNPRARLSDSQIDAAESMVAMGLSVSHIAMTFGVHRDTIYKALRRKKQDVA